jgi:hypothetical protein
MNIFDYDIDRIAKNLMSTARMYECDFLTAWETWESPIGRKVKEEYTFEEVMHYITNTFF